MGVAKMTTPYQILENSNLVTERVSITTMLISIRNTELVRCREVVRFSEGPLSEARLYTCTRVQVYYVIDLE